MRHHYLDRFFLTTCCMCSSKHSLVKADRIAAVTLLNMHTSVRMQLQCKVGQLINKLVSAPSFLPVAIQCL